MGRELTRVLLWLGIHSRTTAVEHSRDGGRIRVVDHNRQALEMVP